jgi:hypothetical protein
MAEIPRRIAELLAYMDETRRLLLETAAQAGPAFATVRPRSGSWSAAETMRHLAKVESGVAKLLEKMIKSARENGVGPPRSDESLMTSLDQFGLVDALRKIDAPETVAPEDNVPIDESVAALGESRERLVAALEQSADMDLESLKWSHRVMGDLNMYQWALFVAQHEERHRRQIERTLDEVTGRAAECAPIV